MTISGAVQSEILIGGAYTASPMRVTSFKESKMNPLLGEYVLSSYVMNQIVERIVDTVKSIQKNPSQIKNPLGYFSFNPMNETLKTLRDLKVEFSVGRSKFTAVTGLEGEKIEPMLIKVQRHVLGFLQSARGAGPVVVATTAGLESTNNFIFHLSQTEEDLDTWKKKLFLMFTNTLYAGIGHVAVEIEDPTIKLASCFEYALLKVKAIASREWATNPEIGDPKLLVEKLKSQGYQSVDYARAGDLVLYFPDGSMEPGHMGVYKEEGLVESKLGVRNEGAHIHPLFVVPPHYGKNVVFLHKFS